MAAPVFDSYGFTSAPSWNNDIAGPANVDEGDLLIAFIIVDETQAGWGGSTTAWPTISGWTALGSGAVSAGGDCSGFVLWKIAGAGDVATGTPVTYTSPELRDGTSAAGSSLIVRVTGADATTPIDGSSVEVTSSGATSVPITGFSTTVDETLLISWAGVDESSAAYDPYWAEPPTAGWTSIIGTSGTSSGQGDSATYVGAQWKEQGTAGSTGTVTMSTASENDAIVGWLVAVRPAAGGPITGGATLATTFSATADGTVTTPGTHTVTLGHTRFYSDDVDASMTALAAEDAALPVDTTLVQNGIVRLRFQLDESGGVSGSGAITLEYDGGSGTYTAVQPQTVGSNLEGVWFRWADGAATDGATLSTTKLTGTTVSGLYLESPSQTVSVGADESVEVDAALLIHWPPPDTAVTLRVLYAGAEVGTVTINTPTAADRPYTVTRLDGDSSQKTTREVRFGPWQRVFWEPDEGAWWLFTVQYDTPTILRSYKRVGAGDWTAGATFTFSAEGYQSLHAVTWKVISGTPTVYALFGNSGSTRYLARGTISSGTLTWGSEQTLSQSSDRHRYIDIDDGDYLWICGTTASTGLWVRRSTSTDSVSAWETAVSVSDTAVASGDVVTLVGLASDKVLVLWRPSGSNTAIKYAVVTAGAVSASGDASSTTTTGPEDWGVTRSGGYVYLLHSDAEGSGGNWILRVFDETAGTWATATSPGVSGQPSSNDGIPLGADGDDIYAFGTFSGTEGGQDRIIRYAKYAGPGTGGSWDSLVTLGPDGARVNSDHLSVSRSSANGEIMVLSAVNDDDVAGNARTIEFFTLDVGNVVEGGATLAETFAATADGSVGTSSGASPSATFSVTAGGTVAKSGGASLATTFAVTADGVVGKSTGAALAVTFAATADGTVAKSTGAALAETFAATADGVVGKSGDASLAVSFAVTAAGEVGGAVEGDATLAETFSATAAGVVGTSTGAALATTFAVTAAGEVSGAVEGSASLTETFAATADGSVGTSSGASLATTFSVTAAGEVSGAVEGDATLTETFSATADGSVGTASGASLSATLATEATGEVGKSTGAAFAATFAATAAGEVTVAGDATLATTFAVTADGAVAKSGGATLATTLTITAAGRVATPNDGSAVTVPGITTTIPATTITLTFSTASLAAAITTPTTGMEVPLMGLHVNDTAPRFTAALTSDGSAVDLTGASVEVHLQKPDGTTATLSATIDSPATSGAITGGEWTGDAALDTAGTWQAEVQVTYSDSTVQTFGPTAFAVAPEIA